MHVDRVEIRAGRERVVRGEGREEERVERGERRAVFCEAIKLRHNPADVHVWVCWGECVGCVCVCVFAM